MIRKFRVTDPIVVREVREYTLEISSDDFEDTDEYEVVARAVMDYDGEMSVVSTDVLNEDEDVEYEEVT